MHVWPGKREKTRVWLPNLQEMWVTRLVVAGLAEKEQPTRVWAGCFMKVSAGNQNSARCISPFSARALCKAKALSRAWLV